MNNNKQTAYEYFKKHTNLKKFVLHHIDVNMKTRNPKRYNEWRITDLVPMTIQDHCSLHMTLRHKNHQMKRTSEWSKRLSKAMQEHNYFKRAGKKWQIVNKSGKTLAKVFTAPAAIAKYIGCTRQTIYKILNEKYPNKSVCGYTLKEVAA